MQPEHRNYSSLSSLPLRPLRPLRLNHSDATGNDITGNVTALRNPLGSAESVWQRADRLDLLGSHLIQYSKS